MSKKDGSFKILLWLGYGIGAVGVGYFLWGHQAHIAQYVPYGLLLLCPLMHVFGGHGGHGGKEHDHSKCEAKEKK